MNMEELVLESAIRKVTTKWTKRKVAAEQHSRRTPKHKPSPMTIREAAFSIMEDAYGRASSNGTLHANARQVYYAARPFILALTGRPDLKSEYFTQTLLKDYIENPDCATDHWRIVWDARGHYAEPHSGTRIGVGGAEVERYLQSIGPPEMFGPKARITGGVQTHGPEASFAGVLFVEKEGFNELINESKICDRFDLALMSTKGIPTKAASDLLSALQGKVTVYVVHDFDKAGFKILKTLREGSRLSSGVTLVDLGLRLEDLEGLQSESVTERGADSAAYLRSCGATKEECSFLIEEQQDKIAAGKRVELNAMTSARFVDWLESKLVKAGAVKVLPTPDLLTHTFELARKARRLSREVDRFLELYDGMPISQPRNLRTRVSDLLKSDTELSWREAVDRIAAEDDPDD